MDEDETLAEDITLICSYCGNLAFRTSTKMCDSCGYSERRQ